MFRKSWLIVLLLGVGVVVGLWLSHITSLQSAYAQDTPNAEQSDKILVRGHSRAISSAGHRAEQFTLIPSNAPQTSFKVIPPEKKLVLTDVMYNTQENVRQSMTVNIADGNPINDASNILFQVRLDPNRSDQVHVCSGYVISAGRVLVAFTNAGLIPEQYVSVSVTGYLVDE